jgi:PleD family two-component response regulator
MCVMLYILILLVFVGCFSHDCINQYDGELLSKKLAFMATIDHLTQLMNRQAFEMFSLNMLADSRRSHTPFSGDDDRY